MTNTSPYVYDREAIQTLEPTVKALGLEVPNDPSSSEFEVLIQELRSKNPSLAAQVALTRVPLAEINSARLLEEQARTIEGREGLSEWFQRFSSKRNTNGNAVPNMQLLVILGGVAGIAALAAVLFWPRAAPVVARNAPPAAATASEIPTNPKGTTGTQATTSSAAEPGAAMTSDLTAPPQNDVAASTTVAPTANQVTTPSYVAPTYPPGASSSYTPAAPTPPVSSTASSARTGEAGPVPVYTPSPAGETAYPELADPSANSGVPTSAQADPAPFGEPAPASGQPSAFTPFPTDSPTAADLPGGTEAQNLQGGSSDSGPTAAAADPSGASPGPQRSGLHVVYAASQDGQGAELTAATNKAHLGAVYTSQTPASGESGTADVGGGAGNPRRLAVMYARQGGAGIEGSRTEAALTAPETVNSQNADTQSGDTAAGVAGAPGLVIAQAQDSARLEAASMNRSKVLYSAPSRASTSAAPGEPSSPSVQDAESVGAGGTRVLYSAAAPLVQPAAQTTAPGEAVSPATADEAQGQSPFLPGQLIPARVMTAMDLYEGASVEFFVETPTPQGSFFWKGVATLGPSKRILMDFTSVRLPDGRTVPVQAAGASANGTLGVVPSFRASSPTAAIDALRGTLGGIQNAANAQIAAGTAVVGNGLATVTKSAPPFWLSVLSGTVNSFKLPETTNSVITLGRLEQGASISLVYGASSGAARQP